MSETIRVWAVTEDGRDRPRYSVGIYEAVIEFGKLHRWKMVRRHGPFFKDRIQFNDWLDAGNRPTDMPYVDVGPVLDGPAVRPGSYMLPEEESAFRLGTPYALAQGQVKAWGLITRENRPGAPWTLVRRIGQIEGRYMTTEGNSLLPVIGPFARLPKMAAPPPTPESRAARKATRRAAEHAKVEKMLATWRRKGALAETKIKHYERRLRGMQRAA